MVGNGTLSERKIVKADFDEADFIDSQELFGDPNVIGSGKLVRMIESKFMCGPSMAYQIIQNSFDAGTLVKIGRKYRFLE